MAAGSNAAPRRSILYEILHNNNNNNKSVAACLLGKRVRIPPGAWKAVCCEGCLLSGRGLSVGLITNPEEVYRLFVSECDRGALLLSWS